MYISKAMNKKPNHNVAILLEEMKQNPLSEIWKRE